MRLKIFDTQKAHDIIMARATLANIRDDFRGMVRGAQLNAERAAGIMKAFNKAFIEYANDVEGDGISQPDLRTNEAEDGYFEIFCYDGIDDEFGVGSKQYIDALDQANGKPLRQYIKSPGGFVDEARAINSQLARYARGVPGCVSIIDATCASAATTIALGLPEIEMAAGGTFMIHRCYGTAQVGYDAMDAIKEDLDRTDRSIARDYVLKTGKELDDVLAMMSAETFMDGERAVAEGFADRVSGEEAPEPSPSGVDDPVDGPKPDKRKKKRKDEGESEDTSPQEQNAGPDAAWYRAALSRA